MWLEMWAYIADVLAFYDERIANESYLRTAARRSSLRRIVELLGYTPRSGIAASATVAALAEGAVAVSLPPGTGFRSSPFAAETPQVFETTASLTIHPLKNQWIIRTSNDGRRSIPLPTSPTPLRRRTRRRAERQRPQRRTCVTCCLKPRALAWRPTSWCCSTVGRPARQIPWIRRQPAWRPSSRSKARTR